MLDALPSTYLCVAEFEKSVSRQGSRSRLNHNPDQAERISPGIDIAPAWRALLGVCLGLLAALLLAVPFLTSGSDQWLGIDWIDGRKLYSIDDAYRYFVAKNAFGLQSVFLWNYVMPVALLFDATAAAVTDGNLLGMRILHAGVGLATLVVIARASLKSGCGPVLAIASVLIVGLMPIYLVLSSSFYGEGLFALMLAIAFLFLIEKKTTLLAVTIGLLPMVRPEGAVYCASFLIYFALRRDARSCALVVLPGFVYFAALVSLSSDWVSSVTWRLELRKILAPLDQGIVRSVTFDRMLNPIWAGLALVSPLIGKYRKWWPILLAPWCLIAVQAWSIGRGIQDFELRYFFSMIPIFAIAWAFPIRYVLDETATLRFRRRLFGFTTGMGVLAVIALHMLQSDWIRQFAGDSGMPASTGREFGDRALWFDPKPLRAFAGRTDAYVDAHESVQTVFIANPAPLYFAEFLDDSPHIDPILIPHNPGVAVYSGGYYFGFSLRQLAYRYYRFSPSDAAPAMLIVEDAGQNPFYFPPPDDTTATPVSPVQPATARVQSASLKAYSVSYQAQNSVNWSIPLPRPTPPQ